MGDNWLIIQLTIVGSPLLCVEYQLHRRAHLIQQSHMLYRKGLQGVEHEQ